MITRTTRRRFIESAAALAVLAPGWMLGSAVQTVAPRPGGARLKTSLNAYSFNQALTSGDAIGKMTLLELLDFCAGHNFDAIDPTGYFFPGYPQVPTDRYIAEFKRRAFHLGLEISGTGIRNNFASPDKAVRAEGVQLAKSWIEVAARMGAPVIRVFAGAVPAGYEEKWEEVADWMCDSLRQCADHGASFGVIVGVQNHGDMLKTADETLKVVRRVDSPWFGVIVDTGYFTSPDPYADIAAVLPYAVNFQVKERPYGKNPDARTDLRRLVKIIRAAGYRGYLPIETLPVSGRAYNPRVLVPRFLGELQSALLEA